MTLSRPRSIDRGRFCVLGGIMSDWDDIGGGASLVFGRDGAGDEQVLPVQDGAVVTSLATGVANMTQLTYAGAAVDVTTAGTAVPLSAVALNVVSVLIVAKSANTGNIYVGPSDVDEGDPDKNYGVLAAGYSQEITAPTGYYLDLNDVYIDADTNGEGVNITYWTA